MNKSRLWGALCAVVFSFITLPSLASLIPVLGGQAYYDDVADLTWLTNANNGSMTWADANAWAAGLNIDGVTGWRLPNTNPIDGNPANDNLYSFIGSEDQGYNISVPGTLYGGSLASEMAYLFYNTLGNAGKCDPSPEDPDVCEQPPSSSWFTNRDPFDFPTAGGGFYGGAYWSATEYEPSPGNAWGFYFSTGLQTPGKMTDEFYAWAVQSGNVGAVPIPAALWLFGSGLLGLVGIARRKKAA